MTNLVLPASLTSVLLILVGCIPYPHLYQHTPVVHGRVTVAGVPAVGTRVMVTWREFNPCEGAQAEDGTIADRDGAFTLTGHRRFRLFTYALPTHRLESWCFRFEQPGTRAITWATPGKYRAGPRYAPTGMSLQCELATSPEICRIVGEPSYGPWPYGQER